MSNTHLFKIVILGETQAGKTSILKRRCDNTFSPNCLPTIGVNDREIEIEVMNTKIGLNLWDTAGQDRFQSINRMYYRNSAGALLVFDLTNPDSFKAVPRWLSEFKESVVNGDLVLVGNKLDLLESRQVSFKEAKEFARSNGIAYIETSAKEGTGINEAFSLLGEKLLKKVGNYGNGSLVNPSFISLAASPKKNVKSGCC